MMFPTVGVSAREMNRDVPVRIWADLNMIWADLNMADPNLIEKFRWCAEMTCKF
jgi:hypothetical protein